MTHCDTLRWSVCDQQNYICSQMLEPFSLVLKPLHQQQHHIGPLHGTDINTYVYRIGWMQRIEFTEMCTFDRTQYRWQWSSMFFLGKGWSWISRTQSGSLVRCSRCKSILKGLFLSLEVTDINLYKHGFTIRITLICQVCVHIRGIWHRFMSLCMYIHSNRRRRR